MKNSRIGVAIACTLLMISTLSVFVLPSLALVWHGGKVLVLYRDFALGLGWVQRDYKTSATFSLFRAEFADQGWTADYATGVTAALLNDYDALFVLTPSMDIPDNEANAIIEWVKDGGQLLITQNDDYTYADEITSTFGITWVPFFTLDPYDITVWDYTDSLTSSLNVVHGDSANTMTVVAPAKAIGWNETAKTNILFAVAEGGAVGQGIVVALCDEYIFYDPYFSNPSYDNEKLMDNVLARFWKHSSPGVPEFSVTIPVVTSLATVFYIGIRRRLVKRLE